MPLRRVLQAALSVSRRWNLSVAALALPWLPLAAHADAIMVSRAMTATTIAEFFVEHDHVHVELEIGVQDLEAFRNLLPDPVYEQLGGAPEPLAQRLTRFFREDLVVRAEGGEPLPGRLRRAAPRPRVRRDEVTGEPLPEQGDEEMVVFAVLEYPFEGRPASLSFALPARGGTRTLANVGFVAYHLDLPVNDFRYLAGDAVLDLDWEDPWYSRFRSRNLRRQYDAPIHAFLYVEPYEVRIEIIARPLDLQRWIDLGVEGRSTIPPELQPELERRVAGFLAEHLDLTVDGEPTTPTLDRIHFLRRTLRTSRVIDPREELDVFSATLGIIFVAQRSEPLPQQATLTWSLFDDRIRRVPAAATDEAGPLPTVLQPDDRVLRWQNFLKNPTLPTLAEVAAPPRFPPAALGLASAGGLLVSLLLGVRLVRGARRGERPGRGTMAWTGLLVAGGLALLLLARGSAVDDARAQQVVGALLHNVYRAFDFRDESAIYDVLARSVAGELLAHTYLETRRGLELASQGGARVKVEAIELVSVAARPLGDRRGFLARCSWNVRGSVGHWGHIHQRTNQYEAELAVEPIGGDWKITGLELFQEQRL
jgi:hypothetical protein